MEMTESQPTCWSWSDPPHHRVDSNNRQRQVNFQRILLFPSPFSLMSFSYISIYFELNSYGPTMGTAETQPTNWIIPPALHHHLANNNRQRWVYFCGVFSCQLHFLQMVHSYLEIFFQFIIYGPTMGRAEAQPTDWVWPPTPHHHLANNNRQQRIYFCGEVSCPLDCLQMLHSYVESYF